MTQTLKKNTSNIIPFQKIRKKKLEEKKRKTQRVLLKNWLELYSVTATQTPHRIDLVDVSEHGLAFKSLYDEKNPWPKNLKDFEIRIYFSQNTYLPLQVQLRYATDSIEEGVRYIRYGCKIKRKGPYKTYQYFIKFLKNYSKVATIDSKKGAKFYT